MQAGRDEFWRCSSEPSKRTTARVSGARKFLVLAALGGVLLGGCVSERNKPALSVAAVPATPDFLPPLAPAPAPAKPKAKVKTKPKLVAVIALEKPERKVAMLDPVSLLGLQPPAIIGILGKPAGKREQAMATEWTYEIRNCSLKIFFYPDIANGQLHALRYDFSGAKTAGAAEPDCGSQIVLAGNDE